MALNSPNQFSDFLSPRFWPTWLGIGLLFLIAWLPYRLRMYCGTLIGILSFRLARERRYITRVNIQLCFPELNEQKQENLVRRTFIAYGIGLIETGTGWVRSPEHFRDQLTIIGLDIMEAARAEGRGVLMLGAHYSTLDFSANLLSLALPFAPTYRAHKNPLFNMFMLRGREKHCETVIDRNDIRGAFRYLKKGGVLWYAPDQDYGPEHAAFAPFFGINAATITTPARFAAMNNSPVVFVRHHRREPGPGYELEFTVVDESFPSGDEVVDVTLMNAQLERDIRHYPHQYLWLHKRFKTQAGGKPDSPYIAIKTSSKTLTREELAKLMTGAKVLEEKHSRDRTLLLADDLNLRVFPGVPGKLFSTRHLAMQFDRQSKKLRMHGIDCITTNNIFRVPDQNLTAVTYFAPTGTTLLNLLLNKENLPVQALAKFLAHLHICGFSLDQVSLKSLVLHEESLAILNPEQVSANPTSLCYIERCTNLEKLFIALKQSNPDTIEYFPEISTHYTDLSGLAGNKEFLTELNKLTVHKSMYQSLYRNLA